MRWILHVDMDAFFASVEQRDQPALRGKPVLVGGNGPRSVVAAASYEARRFGCRSAMPMAKALRLCPGATVVPPRIERYRHVSQRIFALFRELTPQVEGLSLDEAFLDLSQREEDPSALAQALRRRIFETTGLHASAGIAPNKLLAKLASDLNKPRGQCLILAEEAQAVLDPLPVRKLWLVGPKTAEKLAALDIHTIGALREASQERLMNSLGPRLAYQLQRLARGEDTRELQSERERKSVSVERTFPTDLRSAPDAKAALASLSASLVTRWTAHCAHRGPHSARTLVLKVRDAHFRTRTVQQALAVRPTFSSERLRERVYAHAVRTLRELWPLPGGIRLLGLGFTQLAPPPAQLSLFPDPHE